MNTNTRYAQTLNATVAALGANLAFVEVGYGQVEPNHLSAQRTGQIYGQLPAAANINVLQQGQFVKYNYAKEVCDFGCEATDPTEWMLVYNEIKLYREGQNDCEFAMLKTDYNARIYSPYGEDKTDGRLLQSRFYNGVDAEGHSGYTFYKLTSDTTPDGNKTYYTLENNVYTEATLTGDPVAFADNTDYYEVDKTYIYDKVTSGTQDIYEMFQTEDPYHIFPGYEAKKMPEGTKMVPRVFKTNIGDIFTTNTVDAQLSATDVGTFLVPRDKDGILVKVGGTGDNAATSTMRWQIVKFYTMPDGQKGVKLMRTA